MKLHKFQLKSFQFPIIGLQNPLRLNWKLENQNWKFFSILLISFSLIFHPLQTFAQDSLCQDVYGGGERCKVHPDLMINMQVEEPYSAQFRDALISSGNYYPAGSIVTFKIAVTNKSSKNISDINVVYTFPQYTTGGNQTNTFTRNIPSLEKGKTTVFTTQARIVSDKLPPNDTICLTNYAEVRQAGKVGSDITPFCIDNTKSVASAQTVANTSKLPVYGQKKVAKTPATGSESFVLLGALSSITAGYLLRKKAVIPKGGTIYKR